MIPERPWWQTLSACRGVDPNVFYPGQGGDQRTPKSYCAVCPVRSECLEFALQNGEKFGIWGGVAFRERRKLRRARGLVGGPLAGANGRKREPIRV